MPSIVDFLSGYSNQGQMRDFQHASRLYVDNVYALAPKTSWIYYVVFSIEPSAISEVQWKNQRRDYEAGMLVKACDLPKFQMQVETMNQYNKKTNVQTKINYQPISFTFHDDQSNVVNSLWVNYFRYYYRDTWYGQQIGVLDQVTNKPAGFKNNKYEPIESFTSGPDGRPGTPGFYGLNNNQSKPFFNAITIYQLNQKRFTSYIIINPLITQWEHDHLDQTQGNKFAENKMSVAYETVFYGEGKVRRDKPTGFATFHYDNTPSPLSILGGGTASIFGPGGIIAGADELFGDSERLMNKGLGVGSAIGTAIRGANILKNARNITRASMVAEGQSILNSAIRGALNGGPGLSGFVNGGLGALSAGLGFGPQTGTLLVGANFKPNQVNASPGDVVTSSAASSNSETTQDQEIKAELDRLTYTDEELLKLDIDGLDQAQANITYRQNQLTDQLKESEKLDAEVKAKVSDALATSGQGAADEIRKEYANKGYADPDAIRKKLDAYNTNLNKIKYYKDPGV